MSEFRKDPVTGRWVIVAAERAERPQHQGPGAGMAPSEPCPFCAGNEALTPPAVAIYPSHPSSGDASSWSVRVVPNKYPAVVKSAGEIVRGDGFYESMDGAGVHEVIIESSRHVERMELLTEGEIETVLLAYRDRMVAIHRDTRWRHILIYKNQGADAGATLPHVHSQLVGLPRIPQAAEEEIAGAKRFYEINGRCIYCELIRRERAEGKRMVAEDARFVVFSPYASRFPFELSILPKEHASSFEDGAMEDYRALAHVLREALARLDRVVPKPPFNYVIHSNPAGREFYHWRLQIMPRLTHAAGFEWGSGSFINPVAPEEAARLLRGAGVVNRTPVTRP